MQLSDRYTSEPTVSVGILSGEVIRAELCGTYLCSGVEVSGPVEVRDTGDGSMEYDGAESFSLSFVPAGDDCSFVLYDVVIGVGFHWERREDQRFAGELPLTLLDQEGNPLTDLEATLSADTAYVVVPVVVTKEVKLTVNVLPGGGATEDDAQVDIEPGTIVVSGAEADLEGLEEMKGEPIRSLNIVGGGIQNKLLNQMAADATGRPVVTGPIEGAAMGNLLTQAMALGDIPDVTGLRRIVRSNVEVDTYTPNHTEEWEAAYRKLEALMK